VKLCRERGFTVGISNFGSIGLSLRALAALSIDFVKIGKGVVPEAPTGSRSAAIAKAIIDQAHSMGWMVIAETVESASQRDWVIRNGVDALQGYAISSPLTDRDFQNWIRYRESA
jgi:EAL domain-containing protein (putative c-di-GMP-specific phosphodiesterase class I)